MMRLKYEEDGQNKEYLVRGNDPIRIGRDPECEIPTRNKSVSRRHVTLVPDGKGLRVRDEGGANGTFVNNEKIEQEVLLKDGDVVRAGKFELTFSAEDMQDSTELGAGTRSGASEDGTIVDPSFAGGGLVGKVAAAGKAGAEADVARLFADAAAQAAPPPPPPGAAGGSGGIPSPLGPGIAAPKLEIVAGMPAKTVDVTTKKVTFGSQEDNVVILKAEGVSRHHTELVYKDKAWVVQDLGSKNGTYVNSKKVTSQALKGGELIAIGQVQIRFLLPGGAAVEDAAAQSKKRLRIAIAGVAVVLFVVGGLWALLPPPDEEKGTAVLVKCDQCHKDGHKRTDCPYIKITSQYAEVASKLKKALDAQFKDGNRNSDAQQVLEAAYRTGQQIEKQYQDPPVEHPAIKAFYSLLGTFRDKAALNFKEFKWKDPREQLAPLTVNREMFAQIRDLATTMLDWVDSEAKMGEILQEGQDYQVNDKVEESYRTYRKIDDASVYAQAAKQRRDEIKASYMSKRVREVEAKLAANDYENALKLINDALDLLGQEYQDVGAEMIPKKGECERFLGTQKLFTDVDALIKKDEFDAAQKKLRELNPGLLQRVDWVKRRFDECQQEIETRKLVTAATQQYNDMKADTAIAILAPQIANARAEVRELLDRVRKVHNSYNEMVAARNRGDFGTARERAAVIVEAEKDPANGYRKEADQVKSIDFDKVAREALRAGDDGKKRGEETESDAQTLFKVERFADGLAKCAESEKAFGEARERFDQAAVYLKGEAQAKIKLLLDAAQKNFNFLQNAGTMKPQQRIALLKVARAKVSVSGSDREKSLHREITALINRLEIESGGK